MEVWTCIVKHVNGNVNSPACVLVTLWPITTICVPDVIIQWQKRAVNDHLNKLLTIDQEKKKQKCTCMLKGGIQSQALYMWIWLNCTCTFVPSENFGKRLGLVYVPASCCLPQYFGSLLLLISSYCQSSKHGKERKTKAFEVPCQKVGTSP